MVPAPASCQSADPNGGNRSIVVVILAVFAVVTRRFTS